MPRTMLMCRLCPWSHWRRVVGTRVSAWSIAWLPTGGANRLRLVTQGEVLGGKHNAVGDAHPPRVPRKGQEVWAVVQLQTLLQRQVRGGSGQLSDQPPSHGYGPAHGQNYERTVAACMASCCNVIVLREDDLVGHAGRA